MVHREKAPSPLDMYGRRVQALGAGVRRRGGGAGGGGPAAAGGRGAAGAGRAGAEMLTAPTASERLGAAHTRQLKGRKHARAVLVSALVH